MRKVDVEIGEDANRPEGGFAIVLLRGVASLPDRARFRIKPIESRDTAAGAAADDWPRGEQAPVAVRQTDAGIEVVIGPEIVECPALLPGTVGVIEFPEANVRGEFLWPSIRPTARPRRRHLSVVKPARTAARTTVAARTSEPVRVPEAVPSLPVVTEPMRPTAARAPIETRAAEGTVEAAAPALAALNRNRQMAESPASGASPFPAQATESGAPAARVTEEPGERGQVEPTATPTILVPQPAATRPALSAGTPPTVEPVGAPGAPPGPALPATASRPFPPVAVDLERGGDGSRRWGLIAASIAALMFIGYLGTGFFGSGGRDTAANAQARRPVARPAAGPAENTQPPAPQIRAAAATIEAQIPEPAHDTAAAAPVDTTSPEATAPGLAATASELATPASPAIAAPQPAPKAEVTLRLRGGGFQVSGELRGFDGAKYVIATKSSGVMTMDASRFECQGEACSRPAATILPPTERPNPLKPDHITIEAGSSFAPEFVGQLVKAYATSIAATASEIAGSPDKFRINDSRGAELATIEIAETPTAATLGAPEPGSAVLALTEHVGSEDDARPAGPAGSRRAQTTSEQLIGFDGVAAVVTPGRQIAALSLETLAKLYSGQMTDWYDLGAEPGSITLYLPPEGSGTTDAFVRLVLKPRGLKLAAGLVHLKSDAETAAAVARDERGLGLVSFAAMHLAKPLNIETQCGLITRPGAFAVKTEEYPLTRRLYLATGLSPAQPAGRGLIRLAATSELQKALAGAKLVDLAIIGLPLAGHSERMASAINAPAAAFDLSEMRQMLADLAGYSRLSTALRFNSAGELDQRSRKEVARIAAVLKEAPYAGKKVQIGGFTDTSAKFQQTLTLGLKRAGQVRTALLAAGKPNLDERLFNTRGYGALAPIACNSTAEGQRLNRRVEIWVADEAAARGSAR